MSNLVPFQEMESMASYIVRSKLFGAKDESQAMALMMIAQAEGCHPMTAVQDFDIVQGRPARKTHSILARFQAAGGSVKWIEITPTRAAGVFTHAQGGSLEVEWTFEQAKKIGLTGKDNWKNYPKAMLRARCIAEGVRAVFPGAIGGMMSVEEAQDMTPIHQPEREMGAAEVVLTQDWVAAAEECKTTKEMSAVWLAGIKEIQASGNMDLYKSFKQVVEARGKELKEVEQKAANDAAEAARTVYTTIDAPMTDEEIEAADLARTGGPA